MKWIILTIAGFANIACWVFILSEVKRDSIQAGEAHGRIKANDEIVEKLLLKGKLFKCADSEIPESQLFLDYKGIAIYFVPGSGDRLELCALGI